MKRNINQLINSHHDKQAHTLLQMMRTAEQETLRLRIETLEMNFEVLSEMNKYETRAEQHFQIIDAMKAQLEALAVLKKQESH